MSAAELNADSVDPAEFEAGFSKAKSKHSVLSVADPAAQPADPPVDSPSRKKCFILIALVVLLLLLLLGLGYYFFLRPAPASEPKKEPDKAPEAQDSEYDFKAAKEIKETMNPAIDPCIDFYSYSCGGWMSSPSVKNSTESRLRIESFLVQTHQMYRDFMKMPIQDSDPIYKVQPKKFFAACNNTERRKQQGKTPFFDLVKKIGKFPLLDKTWSESDFDMEKIVARLTTLGVHPLFNVSIDTTGRVATFMVIKPEKSHEWADAQYFEWTRKILMMLAPDLKESEIDEQVSSTEHMYYYIYNDPHSGSHRLYSKEEKKTIGRMNVEMPRFDWQKFFEEVIGGTLAAQIYKSTPVTVKEPVKFAVMFNYITAQSFSSSNRTLANYLMMSLLPFASNLLGFPPYERKKTFDTTGINFKDCVAETMENFPDQVNRMYYEEVHNKSLLPFYHEMVDELKSTIRMGIERASWMTAEIKGKLFKNLATEKDIDFPEILLNDSYVNSMYQNVPLNDHFEFFVGMSQYNFNQTISKVGHLVVREPVYPRYSKTAIDYPFQMIDPNMKSSIIFGTAGTLKSTIITMPLLDILSEFPGSNEFEGLKTCFGIPFTDFLHGGIPLPKSKGINNHIYSSLALDKTFEAYQNFRKRKGEERLLPGLNLTHDQLFFLSYTQMLCASDPSQKESANASGSSHMFRKRVMGDLENSADFSKVYGCKSGTPMNTGIKCTMF